MRHQVGDSLWQERLFARLTSAFSALALTLACVGLYGTLSVRCGATAERDRRAHGARRPVCAGVVDLLRQAVVLAVLGVVAGIPLALWGGRYSLDAAVRPRPWDPATIGVTALLLIAVASLAGYLPARRAALTDPAVALKQD